MDTKAAVIVGSLIVVGGVVAAVATSSKASAQPTPTPTPTPTPGTEKKYTCVWGDGFSSDSWDEMLKHYGTVHPDKPTITLIDIQWS